MFSSLEDALKKNPDRPEARLFSILYQLESFRNADGNFHFKLCYPIGQHVNGRCNEWLQSSNPAVETNITGFKAVSLSYKVNGKKDPWVGLGRDGSSYALIDDTPSKARSNSAIGVIRFQEGKKIPGPRPLLVNKVQLFVWNEGNCMKVTLFAIVGGGKFSILLLWVPSTFGTLICTNSSIQCGNDFIPRLPDPLRIKAQYNCILM